MSEIQTVNQFLLAKNHVEYQKNKEKYQEELLELKKSATTAIMRFVARNSGYVKYTAAINILADYCGITPNQVRKWQQEGIEKKYAGMVVELLNSLTHIRWGKYQVCPTEKTLINKMRDGK